ncbi:MAG: glycoside hydrolase family 3 N-terminal domain-containing protein, partial [Bacteroidota bacterium]
EGGWPNTLTLALMSKRYFTMNKLLLGSMIFTVLFQSCAQQTGSTVNGESDREEKEQAAIDSTITLSDFLQENEWLDSKVEKIFSTLDDTAVVAQLIMPAAGRLGSTESVIRDMIRKRIIGGVLMLNGTKEDFTNWIKGFEGLNDSIGNLPFLYSADAEPSLVNRKIIGSTSVKKANELKTIEEVREVAEVISKDLNAIGINYNFSPVVDMSPNKTVGFRSFGAVPANIIPWSDAFIQQTQKNNIIATAKHFPGHGLVSGDTHQSLQVIDGELKEIGNYPKLIENGVLSVMIAHIAVKNNPKYDTKGLPASTSETIVTKLLRDEYGFKGLIVTDAMNMGGVASIPQCEVKAVNAGVDIVLMPVNPSKAHGQILEKYRKDAEFKKKVDAAAKRVIRMKIALGLI